MGAIEAKASELRVKMTLIEARTIIWVKERAIMVKYEAIGSYLRAIGITILVSWLLIYQTHLSNQEIEKQCLL